MIQSRTLGLLARGGCTVALSALVLSGCGGGASKTAAAATTSSAGSGTGAGAVVAAPPNLAASYAAAVSVPTDATDAVRMANQATMGPTEGLVATIQKEGPAKWLLGQFEATPSVYTLGAGNLVDTFRTEDRNFSPCDAISDLAHRIGCTYESYYAMPVQMDFTQQALANPDQLRQRVSLALSQVLVVGNMGRSYATRNYQQMLRDHAFSNYRDLLREVTLSPVMGGWLNLADSSGDSPNENYARELMELFTVGKCNLNLDGTLVDGKCTPPYDNTTVTANAAALSGWTWPLGSGQTPQWCTNNKCPNGANPGPYYDGRMTPVQSRHNVKAQTLLAGMPLPANSTPEQAVEKVLDSVMAHPNIAPFISRTLIQFLVTSNPTPAYIKRVAAVFNAGSFRGYGSGAQGDLKAVVAAILLDSEARDPVAAARGDYGRLREWPLATTSALRVMGTKLDGIKTRVNWGASAGAQVFDAPSVFNYFPSVFSVPGDPTLNGPEFAVQTVQANYDRTNFISWLLITDRMGCYVACDSYNGWTATPVDWSPYEADAGADPQHLVDRLDLLLTAGTLPAADKAKILADMMQWTEADQANAYWWQWANIDSNWKRERVKVAMYLIMTSPSYQVQR